MKSITKVNWKGHMPQIIAGLAIAVFLVFPMVNSSETIITMLIFSGIWAMVAMGFTLVLRTGQFSLGQAAFMAIGGYVYAVLITKLGFPFWASFFIAGIGAGIIAFLIGMVVLRVGDIYFSIITLALTEVIRIICMHWEEATRGVRGIILTPPQPINFGFFEINFALNSIPYYYVTIILLALTGLVFWQIGRTRVGWMFSAMASNQVLAEHQGIHLMKYRVIAFTIAGIFTGFAGALYAQYIQIMTPMLFGLWQSIQVMIMAVVGGMSFLVAGPIVGSVVLYALSTQFSRLPVYGIQPLLFGAVVVLVLVFLPKETGLMDLWPRLWRKILGENSKAESIENIDSEKNKSGTP
jgi:branched-chain amino acid transport system permease protein